VCSGVGVDMGKLGANPYYIVELTGDEHLEVRQRLNDTGHYRAVCEFHWTDRALVQQAMDTWNARATRPERESVTLTASDKYAIADNIVIESRSKSDVVQDVFDELAKRFELRRRG
jgi:ribosomal protein L17